MSKTEWKAGTLLAPLPAVLVGCGTIDKPNAMTAAWTGIINSSPEKTYVSIRPDRYSHELIKDSGVFTINLTTQKLAYATDYCGVRSGRDEDKLAKLGIAVEPSFKIDCPSIVLSPVTLECKVCDIIPLGTHDMFLADIAAVSVNSDLIDAKGKLHLEKADLIAYAHGEYFALGKRLGSFGYSVKKKK